MKIWYIPDYICDLSPFRQYLDNNFKNVKYIFNPKESYFILGYQNCYACEYQNLLGIFASSNYKEHIGNENYVLHRNFTLFGSIIKFDSELTNWMYSLTTCFRPDEFTYTEFTNYCNLCGDKMSESEYINKYTIFYLNHLIDNFINNYFVFNRCPEYFDFPQYCYEEVSISEKATNYLKYLLNKVYNRISINLK